MKDGKRNTFRRIGNSVAQLSRGCVSKKCPFRDEKSTSPKSDWDCDCGGEMKRLNRQLKKEIESVRDQLV